MEYFEVINFINIFYIQLKKLFISKFKFSFLNYHFLNFII